MPRRGNTLKLTQNPKLTPFPLERVTVADGEQVTLWIVDLDRLSDIQADAIAQIIAHHHRVDKSAVAAEAASCGGFSMSHEWVEFMWCGDEGLQRQKELADFFEAATQPSTRAYREFYNSQHQRWIEGNEQPPPINSVEDVDPRLRTPELERALKMRKVETAIAQGNYSVLDVLTGRAFNDALNIIDSENSYSLVGYDDEFDDEEIYE